MVKLLLAILLCATVCRAAVRFDGTDDVLHLSAANGFNGLNFTNDISLSLWLVKEAGMALNAEFLSKGRTLSGGVSQWQLRDGGSGTFDFYFASPNSTFHIWRTTSGFTQTNTPIHVAFSFTYGSGSGIRCWVNGARQAGSWVGGSGNAIGLTNAEPFRIANSYAGSYARVRIQEVAIWNTLLNDDEAAYLARAGVIGAPLEIRRNPDKLRGYWPLTWEFPHWTTASGSNAYLDLSPYNQRITPLNSPQHQPGWLAAP